MPEPRTARSQVIRNTLSTWGYKIAKFALAIFVNPMLIIEYGKGGYGLIILFTTLINFADMADLGVRPALSRQLAEARAKGDEGLFVRLVNSALAVYLSLWVLLSVALLLGSAWFVQQFGTEVGLADEAVLLFRYYGVFTLFVALSRLVFSAITVGCNRFDVRNGIETVYTYASGLGTLAVLFFFDWGIYGWVVVNTLALALNLAMLVRAGYRLVPYLRFSPGLVSRREIGGLYGMGGLLFMEQWARRIKYDADPLIIARFLSPTLVAAYKPGNSLMANVRPLLQSLTGQLMPLSTQLVAQGDVARLRKLFLVSSRYALLLATPMVAIFTIFNQDIMRIWLGRALGPADTALAGYILAGWACIEAAALLEGAAWPILFGMNRFRWVVWCNLAVAAVSVTVSIVLVQYSTLGIKALVIAPAILEAIVRPLYLVAAGRALGVPAGTTLRQVLLAPLCTGIALWAATYGWHMYFGAALLPMLLAGMAFSGAVFAILAWFFGLAAEDKTRVLKAVGRG